MSDTSNTVNPRTARKAATGRGTIAKREWIDANGKEADEELATAMRYTFLEDETRPFTYTFDLTKVPQPGDPIVMLAIFGGLTLAGNVLNSTKDGEDAIDNIKARFDLIDEGTWVSREGVFGPRVDQDTLSRAISIVKHGSEAHAHEYLAKMDTTVLVGGKNKKYPTAALTVDAIREKYNELKGKTTVVADVNAL